MAAVLVPGLALAAEPHFPDPQPYQVEVQYPYVAYPTSYQLNDNYAWESSYPFNPGLYYHPYEQQLIVQDELDVTGGILSTDPTGMPLVSIIQGNIPEAVIQNVPPTVEHFPAADPQFQSPSYNKSYSRTQSFGNNIFGGGYAIDAAITATDGSLSEAKRVEAFAEGKVFGTAFNTQKELVRGRVEIRGQQGGANSGTAALYAVGQQIWSTNLSYTFAPAPINWSRTFLSASKTFMVGPVPINVKASLAGGVKLTVLGEVTPTVARLTATPGGWSNVTASASVSIIIASFGVEGSLTLINATMPSTGELFWPLCTINWKLKSNLALNTLSGTLSLYAKIKFLFFSKKWSVTIAQWNGLNYNWTLVDVNGTKDLGMCNYMNGPAEAPDVVAQAQ
ncbi:hypothetical protein [Hyalangium rubrum]|uniref:Uncharacterized protein n=1 Tax=Hyalangium rubrum TaxID=3103134 RepID=A0ABU5HA22_9BACT|nr:hypothetical protein [Hyalangium sp. s54d21]MDY7230329.1 hypothetical protein [Hyalangium sp. s54d21]